MPDAFELFLSGLSGGVQGFSQRKRENELLQLQQKQQEQARREKNIDDLTNFTAGLFEMNVIDAPTLLRLTTEIPKLVAEDRGEEAFAGVEPLRRAPQFPVTKPSDIDRLRRTLLDSVNKKQRTSEEATRIFQQRTGLQESFGEGRQPQPVGGTRQDKELRTLLSRSDDLRSENRILSSRKNEKDRFGKFARTPKERREIDEQIKANLKETKNINKELAKFSRVDVVEAKTLSFQETFPDEFNKLIQDIRTPTFLVDKQARRQRLQELQQFATPDDLASILATLVRNRVMSDILAEEILKDFEKITGQKANL